MKVVFMLGDTHRYIEEERLDTSGSQDKINFSQIFVAFSVSLCSTMIGYTTAWSGPAIDSMKSPNSTIQISVHEASWIGSLMPLSALVGSLLGGPLIDNFGRHFVIVLSALPVIISYLLIVFSTSIITIFGARTMSGFCVGVCSLALPVYLGETILPEVRGILGMFPNFFGNAGVLVCYVAAYYVEWRWLSMIGAIISIPYPVCMLLVPETPQWYYIRERHKQGRKALRWLRAPDCDICKEYLGLEKTTKAEKEQISSLFSRAYAKPMIIAMGLMFFQQFSGINAFMFYTVQFFEDVGSSIHQNVCVIIIGAVNMIASLFAVVLIDVAGRKVLLCISSSVTAAMLLCLTAYMYFQYKNAEVAQKYGWIPLAALIIYIIGFSIGFGPIPWLMLGEVLPAKIRGTAASIVASFNWACTFVVTKVSLEISSEFGFGICCFGFAVFCILSFFFIIFVVPETRGLSLEDIEQKLTGQLENPVRQVKRTSSKAFLKPLPQSV